MTKKTIEVSGEKAICISFSSLISPSTTPVFIGALVNAANNGHDEIHVLLSTPGGTVADGITIYNAVRAIPVPIIMYNLGNVNSIGNVVFQAGQRRIAATSSSFMFHGVGFDIKNTRMEQKQLQEKIGALKNDQSLIAEIMVRHTNLDTAAIDELFLNMAHLSAQEALKRGITDEVTDIHLPQGMPIQQLIFQG